MQGNARTLCGRFCLCRGLFCVLSMRRYHYGTVAVFVGYAVDLGFVPAL
jgi:hypothetical protein